MQTIAVVIPCFKVKAAILKVIQEIPASVNYIIAVDDACPQKSGEYIKSNITDPRVIVLTHSENQGVGGAVVTGYKKALELNVDVVVKVDGDGQMNPALIPKFVEPIFSGRADYTKGNRFFKRSYLNKMPFVRLLGNSMLSLATKIVTGYWKVMDPTNGYTAIHGKVLQQLDLDRLEKRYYFESDLLFQLGLVKALVLDVPMAAHYADEESSLRILPILKTWPQKMIKRTIKRIIIQYYVRDFTSASLELAFGLPLVLFGVVFGSLKFAHYSQLNENTPSGVVMIAALPIFLGFQLILSAIHYDIENTPTTAIHPIL